MVREKDVREAEIWPWSEGGVVVGEAAKASRSLRMEEDCLRAELKMEFWEGGLVADVMCVYGLGPYHDGCMEFLITWYDISYKSLINP